MRFTEKYDLSRTQWERLIDEWIFNEDHRRMVKRKLLDGLNYEKLAEEFEITCNTAKRIIRRYKQELTNHLK